MIQKIYPHFSDLDVNKTASVPSLAHAYTYTSPVSYTYFAHRLHGYIWERQTNLAQHTTM